LPNWNVTSLAEMSATSSPHFRILEDIARDLSGDINFPTCMDAAILVRNTLRDPYASLPRVVQVIGVEPLISSKLLKLANSVAYNPSGRSITELSPPSVAWDLKWYVPLRWPSPWTRC
jgi:hypothetical protein